MESFIDNLLKYFAVIGPIMLGIAFLYKKLNKVDRSIGKIDKKKVSHKVCEKRRAQCPCSERRPKQ